VDHVRKNTSNDWQLIQSVQVKLRVLPDDPSTGEYSVSVNKVLDQAEKLADYWSKA